MAIEFIPVVIAVKDRPELTRQTVETALSHTAIPLELLLVDDGSANDVTTYLRGLEHQFTGGIHRIKTIIMPETKYVGAAKNAGAAVAYPGDYIYFSDNDVYFCEGWMERLLDVVDNDPDIGILGGDKHPHHGIYRTDPYRGLVFSDQQVGYSMMMRFDTFRKAGPFTHAPQGVFGMEDTDLCNAVSAMGLSIASVDPRVVIHCGLTTHTGAHCVAYPDYVSQHVPEDCLRL